MLVVQQHVHYLLPLAGVPAAALESPPHNRPAEDEPNCSSRCELILASAAYCDKLTGEARGLDKGPPGELGRDVGRDIGDYWVVFDLSEWRLTSSNGLPYIKVVVAAIY